MNSDPYGAGWMFRVELSDPAELDTLMDAAAYRALVALTVSARARPQVEVCELPLPVWRRRQ